MNLSPRTLILGFVAGALSVLVFHQGMVFLLHMMKQTPNAPWNFAAMKTGMGLPVLVNQMFWGGLWGVAFAAVSHLIPVAHNILRGAIFGLIGPFLLGGGVLVPLLKQTGPYFWAWPGQRWIVGGLIGAAFGIG
ncbi:MAG: hypothetical protein ACRCWF_03930, partial [Beijerinckiaceae bacterium]